MPLRLRIVQVLMFVVAGLTAVLTVLVLAARSGDADVWVPITLFALPGLVSLFLALIVARRDPWIWWGVLALQVYYLGYALVRIAGGDLRGIGALVLPLVIGHLATRSDVRDHFTLGSRV